MANSSKKVSNGVVYALLYIVLGVLFIVFKSGMLNWLMTIAGIVFIALGIFDIIKKRLTQGIIETVIGVVIIVGGWLFVEIVLLVFGALLIVKGVTDLIKACQSKSKDFSKILCAVITAIVGILLVVAKWCTLDWFFIVLGAVFIIDGLFALFNKA